VYEPGTQRVAYHVGAITDITERKKAEDGKVAGALSVERSDDLMHARRLIESGADVSGDHEVIADVDSELDGVG
jgi:DNA topoisomerase VI subunit A